MNRPKEVLKKKDMESLMYDVYLAEALIDEDYKTFDTPEKKEAFINEVFRKHGITEAYWDTSLAWYSDHIEVYLKMNDSVKSRLQREQKRIDILIAQKYAREQEVNRQNLSPSYIPPLYTLGTSNDGIGFSFRLDTAEINKQFTQNDFAFRFAVIGIPEQERPKIKSMLILEYNDTTIYRIKQITGNEHYSLSGNRYLSSSDTLQHVSGFIRLEDSISNNHIQIYGIAMASKSQSAKKEQIKTKDNTAE